MLETSPVATWPANKARPPALWLIFAFVMIGLVTSSKYARADQTVEQFAQAFKVAYESRNAAALKRMLYLEGTPDMKQSILKEAVILPKDEKVLRLEVVAAKLSDSKPKVMNGNTYVPNIKVLNRFDVVLGQSGGSYGRFFVVGRTPSGNLAIGGIRPSGKLKPWKVPAGVPKPKTAEAFIKTWKAAYNAGDGKTIAKMYHFEGAPDDLVELALLFSEPDGSINSVKLAPHAGGSKTINGNLYVANATNLKVVKFAGVQTSGSFVIGKTSGGYYAISSWKRKTSPPKTRRIKSRSKVSARKRRAAKRKNRIRRRACGGTFMYRKGRKCVDARS